MAKNANKKAAPLFTAERRLVTLVKLVGRTIVEVEGGGFEVINFNTLAFVSNGSAFVAGVVADEMTGGVGVSEKTHISRADTKFIPNFGFKIGGEEGGVAVFKEDAVFFKRLVLSDGRLDVVSLTVKEFRFAVDKALNEKARACIVVEFVGSGQEAHDRNDTIGGVVGIERIFNAEHNEEVEEGDERISYGEEVSLLIVIARKVRLSVETGFFTNFFNEFNDILKVGLEYVGVSGNVIVPRVEEVAVIIIKEAVKLASVLNEH